VVVYSFLWETHRKATEHHLPYGISSVTCSPTQMNVPALTPAR